MLLYFGFIHHHRHHHHHHIYLVHSTTAVRKTTTAVRKTIRIYFVFGFNLSLEFTLGGKRARTDDHA